MGAIVVADDHPLFREALKSALHPLGYEFLECGTLDDCHAVLEVTSDIELLLLDLNMPGSLGLYGLVSLRNTFPQVPIVVVSGDDRPELVDKSQALGALGFVPKSTKPDQIRTAIERVLNGDSAFPNTGRQNEGLDAEDAELAGRVSKLTPQQYTVWGAMRDGKLNKEVADELAISEATVKAHVSAIFKKLEVSNRTQAVLLASKLFLE